MSVAPEPTVNIDLGDMVMLPSNFKEMPTVSVVWMQDSTKTTSIYRKASYHVAYGFVASDIDDRAGKEILVFVATEYMADTYAFVLNHLTQLWAPVAQPFTIPKGPKNKPNPAQPELGKYIQIDRKWQYGVSGKDRFLVYHPKTRKPFDHRFITAMLETPGSLNTFFADAKQGMSLLVAGSKSDGSIALAGLGACLGLGVASAAASKFVELSDAKFGNHLKDFQ